MKFECVENGVRCIDDSVRISVAGDYGDIYAFDAGGAYQKPRHLPEGRGRRERDCGTHPRSRKR